MPQQWEYCSIGPGERTLLFRYPLGSAGEPIKRDRKIRGDKDWTAAFRLMDKLGAEGRELVTVAGEYSNRFFFKRLKPALAATEVLPVLAEPAIPAPVAPPLDATQPTVPQP